MNMWQGWQICSHYKQFLCHQIHYIKNNIIQVPKTALDIYWYGYGISIMYNNVCWGYIKLYTVYLAIVWKLKTKFLHSVSSALPYYYLDHSDIMWSTWLCLDVLNEVTDNRIKHETNIRKLVIKMDGALQGMVWINHIEKNNSKWGIISSHTSIAFRINLLTFA